MHGIYAFLVALLAFTGANARLVQIMLELNAPTPCDIEAISEALLTDVASYDGVVESVECTSARVTLKSNQVGRVIASPEQAFPSLNPYLVSVTVEQKKMFSPPPVYVG